jgi:DNA-directed RNA polymerase specialized sigma24 family protein
LRVIPAEFEVFCRRHVMDITRFVTRRVSDPRLAADLTAEVFLAVIDSARTYQPGRGTQRAWLYGIVRNVIAAERRCAAHELRTVSQIAGRRLLDDDDIARMEERIDAECAARQVFHALVLLPADCPAAGRRKSSA